MLFKNRPSVHCFDAKHLRLVVVHVCIAMRSAEGSQQGTDDYNPSDIVIKHEKLNKT